MSDASHLSKIYIFSALSVDRCFVSIFCFTFPTVIFLIAWKCILIYMQYTIDGKRVPLYTYIEIDS